MFEESSEEHGIWKSHLTTLSHDHHSVDDVVGEVEGFGDGETIKHVAKRYVWMIFVTDETNDIFIENEVPFVEDSSVAVKLSSVTSSLRRPVRGGSESSQLSLLQEYIEGTILSSLEDRWVWDLNGEGVFCVKDVRNLLDDVFLPKAPIATRWIK
ncbi:hypothetical protein Tco_1557361, partial [Tanacetum coccineum]